jgi:hypothetical protein
VVIAEWRRGRFRVVAAAVSAVGCTLIAFVGYALLVSGLREGRAQRSLSEVAHVRVASPDIGLDNLVVASESRHSLTQGPGFAPGSGPPGGAVPIVIVGHRVANGGPFRHLGALRGGNRIVLTDHGTGYVYVVDASSSPRRGHG